MRATSLIYVQTWEPPPPRVAYSFSMAGSEEGNFSPASLDPAPPQTAASGVWGGGLSRGSFSLLAMALVEKYSSWLGGKKFEGFLRRERTVARAALNRCSLKNRVKSDFFSL